MTQNPQTCQVNYARFDGPVLGLPGEAIAAPYGNISGGDYFLLAHQECLSYMCLFIEDLDKLTDHRFALQRKMPLDGQKGAR
jgi:hypothetical protein